MSRTPRPSIVLAGVSFTWPDGAAVLREVHAAFSSGRTGLIGANGTGKSTLLRLIAGELTPTAGTLRHSGQVGYLPQQLTLRTDAGVADLLGVGPRLRALRAIESGDTDPRHFDALGEDWDIEARSRAVLDELGLTTVELDRPVSHLSGGEVILAALAGLRLAGTDIVLLDEPTNDLDRQARHQLYDTIATWPGTLIVVSHDVALLELMDETSELIDSQLSVFGGPYSQYRDHVAQEQAAAQQAVRSAEQALKTERSQRIAAETKLARRSRYARSDFENKRKPKIVMNQRKSEAQVSAGKLRGDLDNRVDAAQREVQEQSSRLREEAHIRIQLPDPGVASTRRLATLQDHQGTKVLLSGPQHLALGGRNGIGKTRMLRTLLHPEPPEGLRAYTEPHTDRIGYLPQRLDHLDDDASVLDVVRGTAPATPIEQIRGGLAQLKFRAETVHRQVGSLSGGERFRVALAQLLLADPAHQLLVLDEPTNNLDLHSIDELVDALAVYRGGLIVVSHDDAFLARLQISTWLTLDRDGLHTTHLEPNSEVTP